MRKDIYIIKNKINDKCYIGQSVDYKTRFRKHCEEARRHNYHYKSCLYDAMNELGVENFYVELLEADVEDYDSKEIYYIQKYNTLHPNGYNLSNGGCRYPNLSGINHHNAKILSQEILNNIYNELLYTNYSLKEIGEHYNVEERIIQSINKGETYKDDSLQYPLREFTLSKEKLDRLTYDLKYSNLSYQELASLYHISLSQVKSINYGFSWRRDYLTYPIRRMIFTGNDNIYEKIQKDLLSTSLSLKCIAKKYECPLYVVNKINYGKLFKNDKLQYPLRKQRLSTQDISEIHILLIDNIMSINEIAKKYNTTDSTIKRINTGITKKYRDDTLTYPLR